MSTAEHPNIAPANLLPDWSPATHVSEVRWKTLMRWSDEDVSAAVARRAERPELLEREKKAAITRLGPYIAEVVAAVHAHAQSGDPSSQDRKAAP